MGPQIFDLLSSGEFPTRVEQLSLTNDLHQQSLRLLEAYHKKVIQQRPSNSVELTVSSDGHPRDPDHRCSEVPGNQITLFDFVFMILDYLVLGEPLPPFSLVKMELTFAGSLCQTPPPRRTEQGKPTGNPTGNPTKREYSRPARGTERGRNHPRVTKGLFAGSPLGPFAVHTERLRQAMLCRVECILIHECSAPNGTPKSESSWVVRRQGRLLTVGA